MSRPGRAVPPICDIIPPGRGFHGGLAELMEPIKTLIVDDEKPARSRLTLCLRRQPDIEIVGIARDGLEAVKLVVNRWEKRGGPMYVNMDQLKQTLGASPFWALPNKYEESMKAIHEARPVVMKGSADLGRSYRDFAKKLGMNGTK